MRLRATTIVTSGEAFDSVTLAFDERYRRRVLLRTDGGLELLLDLPEAQRLRDGDRLMLEDGRRVLVRAADEDVVEARADNPALLLKIAWHLGNRHTPTQILDGGMRIRFDHVLEELLLRLGAEVHRTKAPFDPEGGAYGHGQVHGHDHDHHHH